MLPLGFVASWIIKATQPSPLFPAQEPLMWQRGEGVKEESWCLSQFYSTLCIPQWQVLEVFWCWNEGWGKRVPSWGTAQSVGLLSQGEHSWPQRVTAVQWKWNNTAVFYLFSDTYVLDLKNRLGLSNIRIDWLLCFRLFLQTVLKCWSAVQLGVFLLLSANKLQAYHIWQFNTLHSVYLSLSFGGNFVLIWD